MHPLAVLVLFALVGGCSDRITSGDTKHDSSIAETETGSSDGDGESSTTGGGACTDFATGSLSDDAKMPSTRVTGLGVTLDFQEFLSNSLKMDFICTSNGAVIQSALVLPGGESGSGASIDIQVEGEPYDVGFEWIPGEDVEYSVAVMSP